MRARATLAAFVLAAGCAAPAVRPPAPPGDPPPPAEEWAEGDEGEMCLEPPPDEPEPEPCE